VPALHEAYTSENKHHKSKRHICTFWQTRDQAADSQEKTLIFNNNHTREKAGKQEQDVSALTTSSSLLTPSHT